jgi:cell division protein FtsW (lipid II flippase)
MNKKVFGIMFSVFFVLAATRSIEQVKWVSFSSPAFFIYFLAVGFKEIKNKELKLCLFIITSFGLWAMVTALWSPYPLDTFIRSIVFVLSSWSLIIAGYCWVKNYNKNEFGFLIPLNIVLLIVSVFSLMTKLPPDYWAGYGYGLKSFWGHQNILASLIIFTIPGIFFLPMKVRRIKIIAALILSVLNVYILVLTHSRTSLSVLLLSILLFILLSKHFKVFWLIILIFSCLATCYFVNKDFHAIIHNYLFKTEISFLDRKKPIISATYEAAGHGGWKGLGYGVSDSTVEINLKYNIHYHFEGVRLVREKGISIFALMEETGWVGLILFLISVGYLFYVAILAYWKTMDWKTALIICVLFGMCLHAQLEGWWLGVGSVQFPLFMGVAGVTIGKIRINSDKKS